MSEEDYQRLTDKLNEARQALVDREKEVSRVIDTIENEMTLLGATGVEDQLQDGVPETLEALRAAGIKVTQWPLSCLPYLTAHCFIGLGIDGRQIGNSDQYCLFMRPFQTRHAIVDPDTPNITG